MTSTETRAEKEAERMHNPNEVDANTTGNNTVDKQQPQYPIAMPNLHVQLKNMSNEGLALASFKIIPVPVIILTMNDIMNNFEHYLYPSFSNIKSAKM